MYNSYYSPNQMMMAQQRLNQMEQQYPQYSNNPMMQPIQQPVQQNTLGNSMIKGRAVTSIDEAKAAMIDLDGSMFVFPDIANKRIYTKQINLDGTASLNTYILQEQKQTEPCEISNQDMVSKQEFDSTINSLTNYIKSLEIQLSQINTEVNDNGKPNANYDKSNEKSADEQPTFSTSTRNGKWKK